MLGEVGRIAGERGGEQLEHVERKPAGVHLLKDRSHRGLGGVLVQLDGRDLVALHRREDFRLEPLDHGRTSLGGVSGGGRELPEPVEQAGLIINEPERKVSAFAFLGWGRHVQLDVFAEVRACNTVARHDHHRVVASCRIRQGLRDVDIEAFPDLFSPVVLGLDDAVAGQRLIERSEPLLTVQQEQARRILSRRCGRSLDRFRLETSLIVSCLQKHHYPKRMTEQYSRQKVPDALLVPLVTTLEVGELNHAIASLVQELEQLVLRCLEPHVAPNVFARVVHATGYPRQTPDDRATRWMGRSGPRDRSGTLGRVPGPQAPGSPGGVCAESGRAGCNTSRDDLYMQRKDTASPEGGHDHGQPSLAVPVGLVLLASGIRRRSFGGGLGEFG